MFYGHILRVDGFGIKLPVLTKILILICQQRIHRIFLNILSQLDSFSATKSRRHLRVFELSGNPYLSVIVWSICCASGLISKVTETLFPAIFLSTNTDLTRLKQYFLYWPLINIENTFTRRGQKYFRIFECQNFIKIHIQKYWCVYLGIWPGSLNN